jgi:hypothetical protein
MPFTAEMEQSIAQICSTKQDITMIEFKNEELGKIKERNFLVRKACQGKHQHLHQHVHQHVHHKGNNSCINTCTSTCTSTCAPT